MLNMIVGVVVENFQRCRERLEDEEKQRSRRKLMENAKTKNQEGRYNSRRCFGGFGKNLFGRSVIHSVSQAFIPSLIQ